MIRRSRYFNTLLGGKFKEAGQSQVDISQVDPDVFAQLINVLYERPYESSPSLMALARYFETDIDLDMLHNKFEVPEEQFLEYVNSIVVMYDRHIPDTIKERIFYNKPIGSKLFDLPKELQEGALLSMTDSYWESSWDTMAAYFRMKSKEYENSEWKIYKIADEDIDNIIWSEYEAILRDAQHISQNRIMSFDLHIRARSIYEAFLKLRNFLRSQQYKYLKYDFNMGYDREGFYQLRSRQDRGEFLGEEQKQIARSPPPPDGYRYKYDGKLIKDDPVDVFLLTPLSVVYDLFVVFPMINSEGDEPLEIEFNELTLDEIENNYSDTIEDILMVILGEIKIV